MTECDAVADLDALAGPGKGLPAIGADAHMQRHRDLLAGRILVAMAHAFELGGNDLGVVEDQRVAGAQERWQIADAMIGQARRCRLRIDDEQARAVARLAGRSAIRSSGRSKSKRSTRIRQSSGKAKPAPALSSARAGFSNNHESDVGGNPHRDDASPDP